MSTKSTNTNSDNTIFNKGINAYNNGDFENALSFFTDSFKVRKDDNSHAYILRCKKMLGMPIKGESKPREANVKCENEKKDVNLANKACSDIIKKKCYYDVLGVKKTATDAEIRRAYKLLAVKYHPDKNNSKEAADAFKTIAQAAGILNDKEKREFYDKYGTEAEAREKYSKQYSQYETHAYYDNGNADFENIFNVFFGGDGNIGRGRNRTERQYQNRPPNENTNNNARRPVNRAMNLIHMLPLLILLIFSITPYFFNTKNSYSFFRDEEYYKKRVSNNGVTYFVNENFDNTYKTPASIKENEGNIEKDYVAYLNVKCSNLIKYKKEVEYKMLYYRNSIYRGSFERELKNIDLSVCDRYNQMRVKIR